MKHLEKVGRGSALCAALASGSCHFPLLPKASLKSVLQVTTPHAHPKVTLRHVWLVVAHPVSPAHTLGVCGQDSLPSGLLGISVSLPEVHLAVGEKRTGERGSWAVDTPALRARAYGAEGRAKPWEGRSRISVHA